MKEGYTGWQQEYRDCTITVSREGRFQADVYGQQVMAATLDGVKMQIRNTQRPPEINMDVLHVESGYRVAVAPVVLLRRNLNGTCTTSKGNARFGNYPSSSEYFARRDPEKEARIAEAKKLEQAAKEKYEQAMECTKALVRTLERVTDADIKDAEAAAKARQRAQIDHAFSAPLTQT